MKEITVRPLERWMLDTIQFEDRDREIKEYISSVLDLDDARLFGAVMNDRLVGIGGIWKFGYVMGEWGVWLTPEIKERPFWLLKTCLRHIDLISKELKIWRVIGLAAIEKPQAQKFLERLGFSRVRDDSIQADGIDCYVYEKAVT